MASSATRLHQGGHDVTLVARGAHLDAIRADGLRLVDPGGEVTLRIPVVVGPEEIQPGTDLVVLLAMKSQDTEEAVARLARVAPSTTTVVCMQNGVANERVALRHFEDVYGMCIVCPAVHVEPGTVEASADGVTGLFDVGRYPRGNDGRAEEIAAVFTASRCESVGRPDIMRWKYRKLLNNLGNALDALCGPAGRESEVGDRARDEGVACLAAASIDVAVDGGGPRAPRRRVAVGQPGLQVAAGCVDVAEPGARCRRRDRLPERRDRPPRPAARRSHAR